MTQMRSFLTLIRSLLTLNTSLLTTAGARRRTGAGGAADSPRSDQNHITNYVSFDIN
jgi:hypothetical protein